MASAWLPPVEPWSPTVKDSFAFKSVSQRWPKIITSAIDALFQASYALSYSSERELAETKIQESKEIVEKLSKLKHDMGRDKELEKIGQDGGDPTEEYDEIIEKYKYTWFNSPWLFAECYLYRLIRSIFARSQHWQQYDPFSTQKVAAFRSSAAAILQLSDAVEPLIKKSEAAAHSDENVMEGLQVIFRELVQTSLWGNATDLSLLTHLNHSDLQSLQAGGLGAKAQAEREHFILTGLGGIDKAWQSLLSQKKNQSSNGQSRVDIILDNSGFELFTDLLLGDFIVSSGLADQVVFHPKDMPWFVSDVTPADFLFTLEALQSNDFFTKNASHHGQPESILPPRTSRSSSRQRQMVADMEDFEGQRRDMSPAGSRVLRMEAVPEEGRDKEAYGSRHLQHNKDDSESGRAEEAQDALLSSRGRPRQSGYSTGGSRNLQLDPSFFQNARSHTVSPSRSYVMDSSSMQSFSGLHSRDRSGSRVDQRGGNAGDDSRRGRSLVSEHTTSTQRLASRWQTYLQNGKFALSMPLNTPLGGSKELHSSQGDFWTSFHNYPSLPLIAPQLHSALSSSKLVISKGDLNYRKWCSDAQWPFDTPFVDVLGPIKGTLNLLVLRTNKADVCVGIPKDRLATVQKEDSEWRVDGKYAVIEYVTKE